MRRSLLLLLTLCSGLFVSAQNIGINATGASPDGSAMLDVQSTNKGLLLPRMTAAQRVAIASPAAGLLVYQTDAATGFYYNTGTPSVPNWVLLNTAITGWNTTGNSGTNPASHFIGTTDNQPLVFRINNEPAGRIDQLTQNTALGISTLRSNSSGASNVAHGAFSLYSNLSGNSNVAIGTSALYNNKTQSNLVAIGDSALFNNEQSTFPGYAGNGNLAIGSKALFSNTGGYFNVALGTRTLYSNVYGSGNTGLGHETLYSNTTGSLNVAIGDRTLHSNATGNFNIGIGGIALQNVTSGSGNIAIGDAAGSSIVTGWGNVAVGNGALTNSVGAGNVAIGNQALYYHHTRSYTVAIGDSALYNNGFGSVTGGLWNTAVGSKSLYSNTTGNYGTAVGYQALYSNTTGDLNTAIGNSALRQNSVGNANTALGEEALYYNTSGIFNTASGHQTILNNTSGSFNVAYGSRALYTNSLGSFNTATGHEALYTATSNYNTAMGYQALENATTGHSNAAFGFRALDGSTTGSLCTAIGYEADVFSTLSNATAIGARAQVNTSNSLVLGSINGVNGATTSINVGIGTPAPDARLHIKSNSALASSTVQLLLEEEGDDYTRVTMKNTAAPSRYWDLAAYPHISNAISKMNFYFSATGDVLSLRGDGNATLMGTLTQLSDARLKTAILPIGTSLMRLSKLTGYTYRWKDAARDSTEQIGLLAQEVQQQFPQLVKTDEKGMLSVNYSGLVPVLINALKEQQQTIDTLAKRLEALEKKMAESR